MLKNWTVKIKEIKFQEKGIINFYKYLKDENHKNHKNKVEKIYTILDNNFLNNCVIENVKTNLKNKIAGKGGKTVQNYRKSCVFSLPRDFSPKKEEWTQISLKIYKTLSQYLEISQEDLKDYVFINVHQENVSHLNLVISNSRQGERLRKLKSKTFLKVMKDSFNLRVLEVLKVDNTNYTPKQQETQKTRDKSIYLNKLKKSLNEEIKKEILEKYHIQEKELDKQIKLFFNYLNRYNNQKDIIQKEKNKKQLNNVISKIEIKEIKEEMIKELPYEYPNMR